MEERTFWLGVLLVFIGMGGLQTIEHLVHYIRRKLSKEPIATILFVVGIGLILV